MKYINYVLGLITSSIFVISCEKNQETPQTSAITVINAAVNANTVKVNHFGKPIVWATYTGNVNTTNTASMIVAPSTLNFATYGKYGIAAGNTPIVIVPTSDTLTPIYSNSITASSGDVYSLYLAGQSPSYETILVKENIPAITYTDSSVNVRVINLVPNSGPVNINLSTTTAVNEWSNIAYKSSGDFKNYTAKAANGASYIFQVKDATTGTLRASYTLTLADSRFHSVTLVLKGLVSGTGTNVFGVLRVNNY